MDVYIYAIVNRETGQAYIGSTVNIYARMKQHIGELRKRRHINIPLQQDWLRYDTKGFDFVLLDACKGLQRAYIENRYINSWKPSVYNINTAEQFGVPWSHSLGFSNYKELYFSIPLEDVATFPGLDS